jgi:hypothetical protein
LGQTKLIEKTRLNKVEMASFVKALQNENGVEKDLTTLCKWVREELFFVLIHDLKSENDQTMSEDGPLCSMFVKCFMKRENRSLIVNADIRGATDEETKGYLKHLWTKGISKETKAKGNIRKSLSLEKTAVYAAINDAFKSKFECIFKSGSKQTDALTVTESLNDRLYCSQCTISCL